jgi:hypothetical protein
MLERARAGALGVTAFAVKLRSSFRLFRERRA